LTSLPSTPTKNSEQTRTQQPAASPLVHPVSALLLMAVDALWSIPDMAAFAWILTIPLCFLAVSIPTFLIQRFLAKSTVMHALGVAIVLGTLAAIPTPIMGTAVGAILLTVAGLRSLGGSR
jgi:hypothetical protein